MTLWCSPAPEGFMACHLDVPEEADLAPMVDIFRELLLREKIQNHPVIGNVVREVVKRGLRSDVYDGVDAIPYNRLKEIQAEYGMGFWDAIFALYGPKEIIEYNYRKIQEAFEAIPGSKLDGTAYYPQTGGKYLAASDVPYDLQAGVPGMGPLSAIEYLNRDG